MVRYRRNFVPGGTFFFTVTLADRRSSVLVDHIVALRAAFRVTRSEQPFAIDAIVVLPDHLHTIMTLPPTIATSPVDGGESKASSRGVSPRRTRRVNRTANMHCGSHDFGNTPCETKRILLGTRTTSTTTRESTVWSLAHARASVCR